MTLFEILSSTVLASQGCSDKLPQTWNLFSHSSGGQKFKLKGSAKLIPSGGSDGDSRSTPLPSLLVAASDPRVPWLVAASLQSLPPSSHLLLPSVTLDLLFCLLEGHLLLDLGPSQSRMISPWDPFLNYKGISQSTKTLCQTRSHSQVQEFGTWTYLLGDSHYSIQQPSPQPFHESYFHTILWFFFEGWW